MDNSKLFRLNTFINKAYECFSFMEFLKLAIMELHDFVMYDSGMFFCGISRDCSFFKPYISGPIQNHYQKQGFPTHEEFLYQLNEGTMINLYVYKASDYSQGIIQIDEPRGNFLLTQQNFHIVCIRIVNKGQFLGEIYLHRSKEKPDFNDEDMFILRLLQPHISTVFYIIHTINAVKYIETNNQHNTQKGLCMFDEDLSLISGNVIGFEMLKTSTVFGSSVLHHLKELCLDVLNNQNIKTTDIVFKTKTLKTASGDLKIDIFVKNDFGFNKKRNHIVIMEFCNNETATGYDYKFKFSRREAEIIDGLVHGKNNSQIARTLSLSENTVKTHIKNIYKKTGARNRAELIYMLMLNQ